MLSRLVSLFSPANVLLFCLPHRVLACRYFSLMSASPRRQVVEVPFGLKYSPEVVMQELRGRLNLSADDTWAVGLPLNLFTMVNLTLPAAASENLDQAVRFALMRHVPHDLSQAHVAYRAASGGGGLDIQAVVASRSGVQEYLDGFRAAGAAVSSVFPSLAFWAAIRGRDGIYFSGGEKSAELILMRQERIVLQLSASLTPESRGAFFGRARTLLENQAVPANQAYLFESDLDEAGIAEVLPVAEQSVERLDVARARLPRNLLSSPHQISLVSDAVLRKKRYSLGVQAAAFGFVLLALLLVPLGHLLGKSRQLQTLEKRIEEIRPQADHLSALRMQGDETVEAMRRAAQLYTVQPDVADLLREITEVLPESAWLASFHYTGRQVRIQGVADSATSVIEAVENSPLFKEVGLDSPVTKSGTRDNFQISARIEG